MKDLGRILCQIPARAGSKRVRSKNLRYLAGKPMIAYAVECAQASKCFDDIYINTDSEELMVLATAYGVRPYRRSAELASDTAKGDDFTADFMEHTKPDTLVMVSPVCPLVTPDDVRRAVHAYAESDCDTLISCERTQMQVFCNGMGVNIDAQAPLAPSQENPFVQTLNWAVTIWDASVFLADYRAHRKGYLGTKRLLFAIDPAHAIKISNEADFRFAEHLLMALRTVPDFSQEPRYWTPADGRVGSANPSG